MCSVTAVGVEDLVDERMLQGEQSLIDWKAATQVEDTSKTSKSEDHMEKSGCERPRCEGIPLEEWTEALEAVAELPEAFLEVELQRELKRQLRDLQIGTLLTVRAFRHYGPQRLARELKELEKIDEDRWKIVCSEPGVYIDGVAKARNSCSCHRQHEA